ncbi:MAG: CCA tRNA nucleotidyltransferase, partial [Armatimonadetes bacterium]|nr:CCA tRNA nucleotidyltransferase [Armatimonadota bacterium]
MSGLEVPPALWAVLAHGLRSGAGGQAAPAAYFVGGCVRDSLLGIPLHDLDLAVAGDPMAAARVLADAVQGHPFWLDPEGGVVRVAIQERPDFHVDVCRLKGSLEEDLLARDLTINALAIPLESGLTATDQVVDRCGGRDDLARGVIRFVSPAAPVQDPLRLLRALRFRWKLDFQLDPGTLSRLRECVLGLNRVSGERIRDELFQLLALPNPAAAVRECLELGLGPVLIGRPVPEAGPIVPDPHVVGRAEAALGHLAGRLSDGSQSLSLPSECRADAGDRGPRALLRERLERPAPSGRRRRELLFWIA